MGREEARSFVRAWIVVARETPMKGMGARTKSKIIEGFAREAEERGRTEFDFSQCEIAEFSGCEQPQVSKYIRQLETVHGLIVCTNKGDVKKGTPSSWRLTMPPGRDSGSTEYGDSIFRLPLDEPDNDAWHGWGNQLRYHQALSTDEPKTVAQLVEYLGVCSTTVRRNLNKLASRGFALRADSGWLRLDPPFDVVGFSDKTKREERSARHKTKRRKYQKRFGIESLEASA